MAGVMEPTGVAQVYGLERKQPSSLRTAFPSRTWTTDQKEESCLSVRVIGQWLVSLAIGSQIRGLPRHHDCLLCCRSKSASSSNDIQLNSIGTSRMARE